jgi:hypothetical protein
MVGGGWLGVYLEIGMRKRANQGRRDRRKKGWNLEGGKIEERGERKEE